MKFGPLATAEAENCVLAHSLMIGKTRIRKGRLLTADDLELFAAAGIQTLTVAKPQAGDVDEDTTAHHLTRAFTLDHVRAGAATTGRVNLYATVRGILLLQPAAIDALNGVDESVTLATLANHSPVEIGTLMATLKIMPYFVSQSVYGATLKKAKQINLRTVAYETKSVGLIQTTLAGTRTELVTKTSKLFHRKVSAFGSTITSELQCAHATRDLADGLNELLRRQNQLIIVMGASAISDRHDVVPQAIKRAGGEIIHFGMPVDPGNLLLLGRIGKVPVIGAPGCARSPKLNGFDWILRRLFCGLPITAADIMKLGVGGMLQDSKKRLSFADTPAA